MAIIYDLFEVTSITANTTYSTASGNLLGVVDSVSSTDLDDGEFDEGDYILIGGVSYNIDSIQEPDSIGQFTLGDGTSQSFDSGSESNLDVVFLTVSNGDDIRYFIVPNDSYGSMNVEAIQTGAIGDAAGSDAAIISTVDNDINVVCFTSGTLIETPDGAVTVEDIQVGDLVLTRDNGPQEVKAIVSRKLDCKLAPDRLKPILFEKNSLGLGLPNSRLCVSPQHRMLVHDESGNSVLVPAKALTARAGVRVMRGKRRVTYIHLVFSRHEIIRANGALTESFFPGPMALKALPAEFRGEISDIFYAHSSAPVDDAIKFAAPALNVQKTMRLPFSFPKPRTGCFML